MKRQLATIAAIAAATLGFAPNAEASFPAAHEVEEFRSNLIENLGGIGYGYDDAAYAANVVASSAVYDAICSVYANDSLTVGQALDVVRDSIAGAFQAETGSSRAASINVGIATNSAATKTGCSYLRAPEPQQAPDAIVRMARGAVINVCAGWTDTPAAREACIDANMISGIRVVPTEYDADGLQYPTDWGFCDLNQDLSDVPDDMKVADNVCEI